jgi:hypothetical protein
LRYIYTMKLVVVIIFISLCSACSPTKTYKYLNAAINLLDTTLSLSQRESAILENFKSDHRIAHHKKYISIYDTQFIAQKQYIIKLFVQADYFTIGADSLQLRMPLTGKTATTLAKYYNALLPTKKIVDIIYKNATIKLYPQNIAPSQAMTTLPVFIQHQKMVQQQIDSLGIKNIKNYLIAGHQKDVIISNKIQMVPYKNIVIYGWHKLNGQPIQPVYAKHKANWVDYSQCIRFVYKYIWINGKKYKLSKVLEDKVLHQLVTDEGVIKMEKQGYD